MTNDEYELIADVLRHRVNEITKMFEPPGDMFPKPTPPVVGKRDRDRARFVRVAWRRWIGTCPIIPTNQAYESWSSPTLAIYRERMAGEEGFPTDLSAACRAANSHC
jgi:hypothetical protein